MNELKTQQSAIQAAFSKIESNLMACHEISAMLENKITFLHNPPREVENKKPDAVKERVTFCDHMEALGEISNDLFKRLERAKRNFDEAI